MRCLPGQRCAGVTSAAASGAARSWRRVRWDTRTDSWQRGSARASAKRAHAQRTAGRAWHRVAVLHEIYLRFREAARLRAGPRDMGTCTADSRARLAPRGGATRKFTCNFGKQRGSAGPRDMVTCTADCRARLAPRGCATRKFACNFGKQRGSAGPRDMVTCTADCRARLAPHGGAR